MSKACRDGIFCGSSDEFGRVKIRLAHIQGDDVLSLEAKLCNLCHHGGGGGEGEVIHAGGGIGCKYPPFWFLFTGFSLHCNLKFGVVYIEKKGVRYEASLQRKI